MGEWTFFSNYGHVLVCLARNGNVRLRDVASEVGITERAVQKIVKDLQSEGFISVRKQGRCNRYRINRRKTLRHALESHCTVGKLLALVAAGRSGTPLALADGAMELHAVAPGPPAAAEAAAARATDDESTAPTRPDQPTPQPEEQPAIQAESKRKSKPKPAPPDVEQQGSLF